MVLVPKANRKLILEYLFKEGVLTCKKDGLKAKHDDLDVPNLHVMMVMKSLTSLNLVTEKFNWRWYYYFLKNEGIEFLRGELSLPPQVFPATMTKQVQKKPQLMGYAGVGDEPKGKGKGKGSWGKGGKGEGKGSWGKGKGKSGYSYDKEEGEAAPAVSAE